MKQYKYTNKEGFKSLVNSEVENKETVLLPNAETYEFRGSTHKRGGIDAFLPEGAKVFSHHLKVDKDVVEELTGSKSKKKQSYADLSKKYDTLPFIKRLQEKNIDNLTYRTNQIMLANYLDMQNNIFNTQEESKEEQHNPKFKTGGKKYYAQNGGQRPFDIGQGWLQHNPLFQGQALRGFADNPAGPYGRQRRTGDDIYGGVPQYRNEHQVWMDTYYPDRSFNSRNFQTAYTDFSNNQLGINPDFAAGPVRQDNKYGNITREAPLPFNAIQGNKVGRFTLDEFNTNPNIVKDYGLNETDVRNRFNSNQSYYMDVTAPVPEIGGRNFNTVSTPENLALVGENTKIHVPPPKILEGGDPYEDYVPAPEQVPVGIRPEQLVNGVQQGLLLSQLATLESENPYYTGNTLKAPITRHDPINNRQAERLFNLGKETLEKSNLPTGAKQARLAQLQGQLAQQSAQVDLTNSQNRTNLRNQNNSTAINVYNQNTQNRNQANYVYLQEQARGRYLRDAQKQEFLNTALSNWRNSLEQRQNIGLLNQTSRNFDFLNGRVEYTPGQGTLVNNNLGYGTQRT